MLEKSIMNLGRSCIYPKDVQRITGKSDSFGFRLLNKIRAELGKKPHQFITIDEFVAYTGIPLEVVQQYITD